VKTQPSHGRYPSLRWTTECDPTSNHGGSAAAATQSGSTTTRSPPTVDTRRYGGCCCSNCYRYRTENALRLHVHVSQKTGVCEYQRRTEVIHGRIRCPTQRNGERERQSEGIHNNATHGEGTARRRFSRAGRAEQSREHSSRGRAPDPERHAAGHAGPPRPSVARPSAPPPSERTLTVEGN